MTTLAAMLRNLQRSSVDAVKAHSPPPKGNSVSELAVLTEIGLERQDELFAYLKAQASAVRPGLVQSDFAPRPSLYQEVWWHLTAGRIGGVPYARVPITIDLGATDVPMAIRAIRAVLERHRVLRTAFSIRDGRLAVEICSTEDVEIFVSSADSDDAMLARILREQDKTPSISGRPPAGIHLVTHKGRMVGSLVFHHAIVDHMSTLVLKAEIIQQLKGHTSSFDENTKRLDFYDWAAWERSWFESESGKRVCDYWSGWRERVPNLCSPTGRELDWLCVTRRRHPIHLNAAFVQRILQRASQLGTTPFVIVLSAYVIALRFWSGKSHFALRAVGNSRVGPLLTGVGLFMCHDLIEVDLRGLIFLDDVINAMCAEYRASVALRIPTHMTGSRVGYDTLHPTIGASINFIPGNLRMAWATPAQEPEISLPEPDEAPTDSQVAQPTIILELLGRGGQLSGTLAFNDRIVGYDEQRHMVHLFGKAMWSILDANGKI